MITLQEGEKILLTARRHPFFLFLEMIPLLPLLILPVLLVILGQFVDIGSILEQQTNTVIEQTGIISPAPESQSPDVLPGMEETPSGTFGPSGNPRALPMLLLSVWLLLLWIAAFVIWTDYYLDVLILTNKKIIDIEQKALFSRETTSLPLEKIQDITVNTEGPVAALFHFGNLEIQTAGEGRYVIARFLKNPHEVKGEIMRAYEKAMEKTREVKVVK